ncbi:type I-E CRISPR-associated protein Cas5/CasD [Caenispirillum salinarum]|uniref:type I-E CRISPR-associated protein Cas5/CasD n=1 Tax=Caenispirillum salinarum TaxID=859058 RepID=UPI00384E46C7
MMAAHLVFTIFAPLGAWGSPSPSSGNAAHKATETVPTKSALTGLLGAALGWPRDRLGLLAESLYVAVRVDVAARPQPAADYHTVRKGAPPSGRDRWTRFDELRGELAGTHGGGAMLSRREYLSEGLWTACVRCRPEAPISEDAMASALRAPVYSLYAGRKAFPLGLPPDPEVVEAPGPVAALGAYGTVDRRRPDLAAWLGRSDGGEPETLRVCADHDFPGLEDIGIVDRWLERRDLPHPVVLADGRVERRFQVRREVHLSVPREAACS